MKAPNIHDIRKLVLVDHMPRASAFHPSASDEVNLRYMDHGVNGWYLNLQLINLDEDPQFPVWDLQVELHIGGERYLQLFAVMGEDLNEVTEAAVQWALVYKELIGSRLELVRRDKDDTDETHKARLRAVRQLVLAFVQARTGLRYPSKLIPDDWRLSKAHSLFTSKLKRDPLLADRMNPWFTEVSA
jgi:hypothetical protein